MSKIPVKNSQGAEAGEFDLPDELLVYDKGHQAVHEAIVAYQANQRAGTASTLSKSHVAGPRSKPWKQKGTGRARAGYKQSPVWRGGAVAFGPHPRVFDRRLPRRVARLAFRRAFSEKVSSGQVLVLDELDLEAPKTKTLATLLQAVGVEKGAAIVLDENKDAVRLSARNIPNVHVTTARHLNVYDLLRYPVLLVSRKGMEVLVNRLTDSAGRTS